MRIPPIKQIWKSWKDRWRGTSMIPPKPRKSWFKADDYQGKGKGAPNWDANLGAIIDVRG